MSAVVILLGMATAAKAQVVNFGDRLPPSIPSTLPPQIGDLVGDTVPLGRFQPGIWVAPNVAVDRLFNPNCLFVANQNSGDGQISQRANVGTVLMNCR